MNKKITKIAMCSSVSGLLFGYDAGIISGVLIFITEEMGMNATEIGLVVASVPLGALFSSAISGYISDHAGRKKSLLLTAALFTLGSMLCGLAQEMYFFIIGRCVLGFAIGIGSCVSPVYTAEISGKESRGWLVNLYVCSIQTGIFLSFFIGYLLSKSENWRLMIMLGIIPSVIFFVLILSSPESPRWLLTKNRVESARKILASFYEKATAENMIKNVLSMVKKDKQSTISIIIKQPKFLKVLFIGVSVSFFTQTVGINAFNYYGPTIFIETGFTTVTQAMLYSMLFGFTLVISTISSLFFIDKVGRRKPLLSGTSMIAIILAVITIGFAIIDDPKILALLFLGSAIFFMLLHGTSIGPACFLIPSEIFPNQVRGIFMGISVAINWLANTIISILTPLIINSHGISSLFLIFFILTVIGFIIFYFFVPETKNVELETIEKNIINGSKCLYLGK